MRFLYFGLPLGAAVLARAGHVPQAACVWHLDAPGMRRLRARFAASGERLLLARPDLDDPGIQRALASTGADCILSWFYPRKLPRAVLALAPRGAFGVHPSLLPRWRGADPYFWAIRAGDTETGVTLHRLEPEYDTGEILAQRTVEIDEEDDSWTLARKLDRPSLALLVDCAQRLARTSSLRGTPQDETRATDAPQPDVDTLAIRWDRPVQDVLRLVRAAAPAPGATALLGETEIVLLAAEPADEVLPRALLPGEALVRGDAALVQCRDGAVRLLRALGGEDELDAPQIAALLR